MNPNKRSLDKQLGSTAKIRKVLNLLRSLRSGKTLNGAAEAAAVPRRDLTALIDAIEGELKKRLPKKPAVRKKAQPGSLERAVLYSDGASRGNPGRAACAAILCDEKENELLDRAELLGTATNNVAEYRGVLLALKLARELEVPRITIRTDSELVAKQLQGAYKVKHAALKPLYEETRMLLSSFVSWVVEYIPRAKNMRADELVNAALDE